MSEAANRSVDNLLPLCEEHAFEIDATPEHFPPDILREWKQAQLSEWHEKQKSWSLNDKEAAEVAEKSFSAHQVGSAIAGAASVLAVARAAGLLIETSRQQRRIPREAAHAWGALREQVNRSMPVFDVNGERLVVEPSVMEAFPHHQALETALTDAVAALEPMAATIVAELHAVGAADERLARWCAWVETATADVIAAAGRWPGRPPVGDDEVLPNAVAELQRASTALSAAWRGQEAAEPPEPPLPAPEPVETDQERATREHRELLDTARRWARVKHRPYDADLCARLMEATSYAVGLPGVPSLLPVRLEATAELTADVARNADEQTYRALIACAATRHPLAASVNLVRQLMFTAQESERNELAAEASAEAIRLLRAETWQDRQVWSDNQLHVRQLLDWTASVSNDNDVQATIAAAIENDGDLLPFVLRGIAQWREQRDRHSMRTVIGVSNEISDLPQWFPTEQVITEIRRQMPDLAPAENEDYYGQQHAELQRLASHVLRLAASNSEP